MNRAVQSVLMVLFGSVLVRVGAGPVHLLYVKPAMGPWLMISGVVLIVLGALAAWEAVQQEPGSAARADADGGRPDGAAAPESGAGHAHGHPGPRAAWALLLPVAAIVLVPAAPLGSFTASRLAPAAPPTVSDAMFPPLTSDPAPMPVSEFVTRAVADRGRTLTDTRVSLVGFVSPTDEGWHLARLGLTCCAADAYVFKVDPRGAGPLPADTWVEVVGRWEPGEQPDAEVIPRLAVESIREVSPPENPYDG